MLASREGSKTPHNEMGQRQMAMDRINPKGHLPRAIPEEKGCEKRETKTPNLMERVQTNQRTPGKCRKPKES